MYRYQLDDEGGSGRLVDATFRTVPKDTTTFLIWKVNEIGCELLPRAHYGTFYDADAYLIYSASMPGQPAGPDVIRREIKENGNGEYAERHIHVWAGDRSGQLGGLALKRAAQLMTHLAVPVVIHREAATKESARLLSYFRDGSRFLISGTPPLNGSGARLYRVLGRRPVLLQLEPVTWARLAPDGVFILDSSALLVLWLGRTANLVDKIFGAKIAYRMARGSADKVGGGGGGLVSRRMCLAHDGYEQTLQGEQRALLDALLDLRARSLRPAEPAPPAPPAPRPARLYRLAASPPPAPLPTMSRRAAKLEEIKRAPLYQHDLTDDGVFVAEGGAGSVWARCGAARDVLPALAAARALARARHSAAGTVSVAVAGREPHEFAALFQDWRWADPRREARLKAARCATTRLDADNLAANAWLAAECQLMDDGSGALRVWRVRGAGEGGAGAGGAAPGEAGRAGGAGGGALFERDCYIALYTYHAPHADPSIIYYWMGGSSPNNLRDLGAKEAKDLYTKLGRLPVQVWMYQGQETAHFLQIFKGRMITYSGSATDYDPTGRRIVAPTRALIRVSGSYAREARGVEVSRAREGGEAGAGGRGACYILREHARVWVWCALSATGDEREVAKNMAAADHTLVMQGKEKEDFWSALGSRRALLVAPPPRAAHKPLPPRLFYVQATAPALYTFSETLWFRQQSLCPEGQWVLDCGCAGGVWVWSGAHAPHSLTDRPRDVALAYLAQDPSGRDLETPITAISQGREPPNFTGFFPSWKNNMWKSHKTFSAIISVLEGKSIVANGNGRVQSGGSFDRHEKYPLALLRGPHDQLPQDVDPLVKELYLTHDDFVATFDMPYSEFKALPTWKQKDLKKAVGLF